MRLQPIGCECIQTDANDAYNDNDNDNDNDQDKENENACRCPLRCLIFHSWAIVKGITCLPVFGFFYGVIFAQTKYDDMNEKLFLKLKQAYTHLGLAESILQAHADVLAGLGVVTDENVDQVVSNQKAYLEGLQIASELQSSVNDQQNYVNGLDAQLQEQIAAQIEAERKAAEEQARKEAEEKARKEAEEAARKAKEEAEKQVPESVKAYLESIKAEREAEKKQAEEAQKAAEEARKATEDAWNKKLGDMQSVLDTFKKENEDMKKAEALRQRKSLIETNAKELGIPQYRIDEGFVIADDADEAAIGNYLSNVAKNIKTATLPGRMSAVLAGQEAGKEEVDSIADSLVKQL